MVVFGNGFQCLKQLQFALKICWWQGVNEIGLVFDSLLNGCEGGLWWFRADFVIDVNRLQRNGSRETGAILLP